MDQPAATRQDLYTLVARYRDGGQIYVVTVTAPCVECAMERAQVECCDGNGWKFDRKSPPLEILAVFAGEPELLWSAFWDEGR